MSHPSLRDMDPNAPADDPTGRAADAALLVEVLRDGRVESMHHGHVAVVSASGRLLAWTGNPSLLVFPRSTLKPFQALPLVESGAFARSGLGPDALALIAGSHGGTDAQAELVRAILGAAGTDERSLRCGEHTPYDEPTAAALRARGEAPGPLRHNCSGKHAGMLLLARELGAPLEGYLDPAHPVQRAILSTIAELTGESRPEPPAVDGCGAPAPRVALAGLAHAFALLASGNDRAGRPLPALARIRDAMRAHPENVAGDGRFDTKLMRAARDLVAKIGAEGVHATGSFAGGIGIAVKVADGAARAVAPAVLSALAEAGVLDADARRSLQALQVEPLRNNAGAEVGAIQGVARLTRGPS